MHVENLKLLCFLQWNVLELGEEEGDLLFGVLGAFAAGWILQVLDDFEF